jgi:hypothetical protein
MGKNGQSGIVHVLTMMRKTWLTRTEPAKKVMNLAMTADNGDTKISMYWFAGLEKNQS